ncbi:MAG: GNAT family N-acetyltransferase [Candidatus Eisenbacteria sp.]|nr:GNAT family N-acetyltransferase [Candidatus Eisenbacteria bacterium]
MSRSGESRLDELVEGGLVLRSLAGNDDLDRVVACAAEVFGSRDASLLNDLFRHHPHADPRDLLYIEDPAAGRVVSTLTLIPWSLSYEGVDLPAAEMAIVATLEGYRRRGLSRRLTAAFMARLRERGCLISHIQGIPYFYRQFGYEYAMPLEGGLRLEGRQISDAGGADQKADSGAGGADQKASSAGGGAEQRADSAAVGAEQKADSAAGGAEQNTDSTAGATEQKSDSAGSDGTARFTFRLATPKDIADLMRLYEEAAEDLAIHTRRGPEIWEYVLTHGIGSCTEAETWVVERQGGNRSAAGVGGTRGTTGGKGASRGKAPVVAGYFRLPKFHFNEELRLSEASRLSADAALAVLQHLKKLMTERKTPGIQLNDVPHGALMRLARALGATDLGTYPWQILIPDPAAFLRALAPVWERRIAESPFAGLTRAVAINLYRRTIELNFADGRVSEVIDRGPTEDHGIQIPPGLFAQLAMGWRTQEELRAIYPDVIIARGERMLVDTLFPKRPGFLHQVY